MEKDAFKKFGYACIDWVADYMTDVAQYPVISRVRPGQIKEQIPPEPPLQGESMERILEDFKGS